MSGVREFFNGNEKIQNISDKQISLPNNTGPYINVVERRQSFFEKVRLQAADFLRNSPFLGLTGNPFFKADAAFVDLGGCFVGAEYDRGILFVLAGQDIGAVLFYSEQAGGMSTDAGIGLEVGRIDATIPSEDFRAEHLFGPRMKYWTGFSPTGEFFGVGAAYSFSSVKIGGKDYTVHSTAIQGGLSISPFPFVTGGGVNQGLIK